MHPKKLWTASVTLKDPLIRQNSKLDDKAIVKAQCKGSYKELINCLEADNPIWFRQITKTYEKMFDKKLFRKGLAIKVVDES